MLFEYFEGDNLKLSNELVGVYSWTHDPVFVISAKGGISSGNLPADLQYRSRLRGFSEQARGDHIVELGAQMRKLLARDLYNESVSLEGMLYSRSAGTRAEDNNIKSVAGIGMNFGLQDMSLEIGYSHPLYENGDFVTERSGEFYFDFNLNFFSAIMGID